MKDYNVGLIYKEDLSDLSRLSKGEYVIAAETITIMAGIATITIEAGD